jgi:hypothetical protein
MFLKIRTKLLTSFVIAGILCGCATFLRYRDDVAVTHLPAGSVPIYTNNDYIEYISSNVTYKSYYRADGTIYATKTNQ